jgi:hypothetical protein
MDEKRARKETEQWRQHQAVDQHVSIDDNDKKNNTLTNDSNC